MKLTHNFALSEFEASATASARKLDNSIPAELLPNIRQLAEWLQVLRDRLSQRYGKPMPIVITSGFRGVELNKAVGGSSSSAHCQGLAADIQIKGMQPSEIIYFIKQHMQDMPVDQVIDEDDGSAQWVHIGLAPKPRGQFLVARKVGGKMTYALA